MQKSNMSPLAMTMGEPAEAADVFPHSLPLLALEADCDVSPGLLDPSAASCITAAIKSTAHLALCMYHDQTLIPLKTLGFDTGFNITLGLDFIRTSPDHGAALDIAGQGIADPRNLIEALKCVAQMAEYKQNYTQKSGI